MPTGEYRTIVLWAIAIFTVLGAVRCRICPHYEPYYCACSLSEPARIQILKTCPYAHQGRLSCKPCSGYLQSQLNCNTCRGNTCPICSKYKFGWSMSSLPAARDKKFYTFSLYTGRTISLPWNILRLLNEPARGANGKMGRIQSSKEAQGVYFRTRIVDDLGEISNPDKLSDNNTQSEVGAGLPHSRFVEAQTMSVGESGKTNYYKRGNTPTKSHALPSTPPKKSGGFKTISETSGFKILGTKGFGHKSPSFDPCVSRQSPESESLFIRRSKFHPRERKTILALLTETGVIPKPEDAVSVEQLADHFLLAYRVTDPYGVGVKIRHRDASNHVRETSLDFRFDPVTDVVALCVNGDHVRSEAIDERYLLLGLLQRLREHYQQVVRKGDASGWAPESKPTTRVGDKRTPVTIKVVAIRENPALNETAHVRGKMAARAAMMSDSEYKGTEIPQGRPDKGIENEPLHIDVSRDAEGVVMHVTLKENLRNRREASIVPQNSWCTVPNLVREGDLKCMIWTYKKSCTLICHEGCLFAGQPTAQLKCDRKGNTWEPALEPCQCGDRPSGIDLAGGELDDGVERGVLPPGGEDLSEEDDYDDDGEDFPGEENYDDGEESETVPPGEEDLSNQEHNGDGMESSSLPLEGEDLSNEYYDDGEESEPSSQEGKKLSDKEYYDNGQDYQAEQTVR